MGHTFVDAVIYQRAQAVLDRQYLGIKIENFRISGSDYM
jgi:hypothetical protein